MSKRKKLSVEIVGAIIVIGIVWGTTEAIDSFYLPGLSSMMDAFVTNWFGDRFMQDVVPSVIRTLTGFALAVVCGIVIGTILASSKYLAKLFEPMIHFARSIPGAALLPVGILVLGIGDEMKVAVIAFVCMWPVMLSTMDGLRQVDPSMLDTARMYRISSLDRIARIRLPAASPRIFSGVRTSIALSLVMMIISEMVGSTNGLGYFIMQSQRTFNITDMWSGIILIGILGYLLSLATNGIEKRVLAWHTESRA